MIVCVCRNVSEREIRRACRKGAHTLADIQVETGACTNCHACKTAVLECLAKSEEAALKSEKLAARIIETFRG